MKFLHKSMAQHNELGKLGEKAAAEYLLLRNYHILEINWRIGNYEVDIIAEKLGFLIFFEVKTRSSDTFERPEEAVDTEKRHHLLKVGNAYIQQQHLDMPCRFDIITLVGSSEPFKVHHIKNAFDAYDWNGWNAYGNQARRQPFFSHKPAQEQS